ncbi:hypothetical protein AAC387_Pa11g0909 [Persea americana]
MHFPILSSSALNIVSRRLIHSLHRIPTNQRDHAIHEAQQALTDYLHSTSCLSFTNAEHITKNSPSSLSNLLSNFKFSIFNVSKSLHRFLRYHPINEFEFFFESIGISPPEIPAFLPPHKFFLSEDGRDLLSSARTLVEFGFPWNKLGRIYKEDVSVFSESTSKLLGRLHRLEALGFNRIQVIGICLAFPSFLGQNDEFGGELDALFDVLKRVFYDFDFGSGLEGNVDVCYEICRKIRVFYNLGCEKGKMGELIGRNRDVFLEFTEVAFVEKVDFFCRLGMRKEDIGLLVLRHPEILSFNLEDHIITVSDYLKRIGLDNEELNTVILQYPHVLGKNRLKNLPQTMKALDLQNWFADRIMNGNHHLLSGFVSSCSDEELKEDLKNDLERIEFLTKHHHTFGKLDFLLGIGFGNNLNNIEILRHLHGTGSQLQERFNCLLHMGIKYSSLCKMISASPKILNQNTDMLQQKVDFLCNELQCSLQHLEAFPSYLYYDLEKRIKPRHRILAWLREKDLLKKQYSLSTVLATSEKRFIACLLFIHPATPKQWLEVFSVKDFSKSLR